MMSAAEVGAEIGRLVERFGHAQVATAAVKSLVRYADAGARRAAADANQVLRDEPLPADPDEMRTSHELRHAFAQMRRTTGHQTFFAIVAVLAGQYAARGARAKEIDGLNEPEGNQTCAAPHCPGCQARLAAAGRLQQVRERTRDSRSQGTTTADAEPAHV